MRIVPSLILGLAALPALAGNVYKWTDAAGQTHYSQSPPQSGPVQVKAQANVQPGVSITAPARPAAAATTTAAAPKAAAAESLQDRAERCTASKQRLQFLDEHPANRLYTAAKDGSESRMTEEEHAASVAKAQEAGKGC